MQGFKVEDTRTLAIVAHSGAGKTSLIEALLHKTGTTSRLGRVDDGSSVCDYNPEEKERKVTIYAKPLYCTHNGKSIFMMDTPGYADFFGETLSALHVVDGVVLVVCGASGIEVGTQRVWKKIQEKKIPCIIFVNKLDKENADFYKVVNSIRNVFGKMCIPVQEPIGQAASFKGMKDILKDETVADEYKNMLIESVSETDDKLLEKYLETGTLGKDEMMHALEKGVKEDKLIPIMGGSVVSEVGVTELLNAIADDMPSPVERGVPENLVKPEATAPYSALVFKTVTDPFVGQLTFFRVYSGTIKADSEVNNCTKGTKEKLSSLMLFLGKDQKSVPEAGPGDIIAVAKLKNTSVNDVFSAAPVKFPQIVFPKPSISFAVQPQAKGDEEKISNGLHRLAEEDHTFEVHRDKDTKEEVVSGMGDLHLEIMLDKLKKKFGVSVTKSTPKIAYKETITAKGDAQYRHKKQSGGAGQFAEVWLRVEPLERGKGFEFVDDVVGGAIPQAFIVSCEKGIKSSLDAGGLAGFPVVDVRAVVYDGKTHPVDSKDIAFQVAARNAFKEACQKARPVLLEPIMNVEVYISPDLMGDVTGDLNGKRGRILGMDQVGDMQVIKAQVPSAELSRYSTDLRSLTGGRGSFSVEFSHYEEVPARLAQDIVANAKKLQKEEAEV